MLKIRLTRRGKKNKAFYRIVVAEHTAPIKGRFLEALGYFNPHSKEKNIKAERVKYWLEKGAQCSDTAHNLLVREGIVKGPKRAIKMKKKEEGEASEEAKSAGAEDKPAEAETKPEKKEEKSEEEKKDTVTESKKEEKPAEEKPEEKKAVAK